MPQVLDGVSATSADVLKIEHRSSEPFDHAIDPAALEAIVFNVGQVVAINTSGFAERGTSADTTTKLAGLFMLNREPTDGLKNNYVDASGNASIFSNGIVTLSTQLTDATINAGDALYVGVDGQITNVAPVATYANAATPTAAEIATARDLENGSRVGTALTSRTVADADVRIKLEL